jgi:hypothetical protein
MLTILGPSKTIDTSPLGITDNFSFPEYIDRAQALVDQLRQYSISQLKSMMKVSVDVLPSVNRKGFHWLLRSYGQYFLTGSCRFLLPTANAVRLTGHSRLPDG